MKRCPDNQINASFIDITRIKWLVFFIAVVFLPHNSYCCKLRSIGPYPVEQTEFRRDIKDNGYKSIFTKLWLERQRNRSWIRD